MVGDPAFIVRRRSNGIPTAIERVRVTRVLKTKIVAEWQEFSRKQYVSGRYYYPARDGTLSYLISLGSDEAENARRSLGL